MSKADRQRRWLQRRRAGTACFCVETNENLLINHLIDTGYLDEHDAGSKEAVERALSTLLWLRYRT
jgi:hypothetical protein